VQNYRIKPDFDLFSKGKKTVDHERAAVHGSTVDPQTERGRSSPELGLAAAPGHHDLPQRHGRQAGVAGTQVAGSPQTEGR
jgi:hypothetical protein